MRLCACAGWCESTCFAHARMHSFAWRGLNHVVYQVMFWHHCSKKKKENMFTCKNIIRVTQLFDRLPFAQEYDFYSNTEILSQIAFFFFFFFFFVFLFCINGLSYIMYQTFLKAGNVKKMSWINLWSSVRKETPKSLQSWKTISAISLLKCCMTCLCLRLIFIAFVLRH